MKRRLPKRFFSAVLNAGGSLVSASVLLPFSGTDPWEAALVAGIGIALIFLSSLGEI